MHLLTPDQISRREGMAPSNAEIAAGLKALRGLLAEPSHWTKGSFAKDKEGEPCSSGGAEATCFCLVGGINRITRGSIPLGRALTKALISVPGEDPRTARLKARHGFLYTFNDGAAHEEVLALIDNALSRQPLVDT